MKVAVTTSGDNPDSAVDSRFGRAANFLVIDTDTMSFSIVGNKQNLNAAQGAGIQSAMTVAGSGAEAVITGHCGPKAFRVLSEAGIKIYITEAKSVSEAVELLKDGKLKELVSADVEGHWV